MHKSILVTGGGGFLGSAICKQLLSFGYSVVSFSRKRYPELEKIGVECRLGNLFYLSEIDAALEGIDAVVHTAALAGVWGKHSDFMHVNADGTRNLLQAMNKRGIRLLVHTSSPSVVFAGEDISGGNEDIPYPESFTASYPFSKMVAEKAVIKANAEGTVDTVILRPHLIWGPGDPHFLPRLKQKSKAGKLVRIGSGQNLVDTIYVDNAAEAHCKALQKLMDDPTMVRGKIFFLGQERPAQLWKFLDQLLSTIGEPPVRKQLSFRFAYLIAGAVELVYRMLRIHRREPPITRFVAQQLAKSHYFDHTRIEDSLGFTPRVSIEEGLRRMAQQK